MSEPSVKEAVLSAIRRKAESMLDTLLAAVDETQESGDIKVNCQIKMIDPIKRKISITIDGSVKFGLPKEATEASMSHQLELTLEEPQEPVEPTERTPLPPEGEGEEGDGEGFPTEEEEEKEPEKVASGR